MNKKLLLSIISSCFILTINAQFKAPHIVENDLEAHTTSFVALWGSDTASIETYTIVGNHLFGRAVHLFPEPHLQQFEFVFGSDGAIREMDVQIYDINNTSKPIDSKTGFLPLRQTMNSMNGVVDFRSIYADEERQYVHTIPRMDFNGGWIPIMGQWQWLSYLAAQGKLSKGLKFVNSVIGDYNLTVTPTSDGNVIFESEISAPITFYVNNAGKIDSINALGSPWNFKVFSMDPIDVEKYASRFASKAIIGNPSPYVSQNYDIKDNDIQIDYGRPSMRGRNIFGNVVPYGVIWRTGAGQPTKLTSTEELVFGDVEIPAGTHNLYTIPRKDGWTLIFNNEPEAWGSAPREAFHFAEVEMKVEGLDSPIELFTIEIIETKNGGAIIMEWEKTMASVEFTVSE